MKALKLGERQYWEWNSKTAAGKLCAYLRFDAEDERLVLTFDEIWSKDPERRKSVAESSKQQIRRADLGLGGGFAFVQLVADLALAAGFTKLRIQGLRTRQRRKRAQRVDFDLERFRRG